MYRWNSSIDTVFVSESLRIARVLYISVVFRLVPILSGLEVAPSHKRRFAFKNHIASKKKSFFVVGMVEYMYNNALFQRRSTSAEEQNRKLQLWYWFTCVVRSYSLSASETSCRFDDILYEKICVWTTRLE